MRKNLKQLTQEEVNNLPIGAKIKVIWSGGNGPHEYIIQDKLGELSCVKKFNPSCSDQGEIDFVGTEDFHTKVWLISLPKFNKTNE